MGTTTTIPVPLDAELVARASRIAAARNMSLEAFLERLLRVVTQPPPEISELGPITRRLTGVLSPMSDEQVRAALDEESTRKYGRQ